VSGLAHLRDTGRLPRPPAGALLISPCVDATGTSIFSQRDDGGAGRYDYLPRDKLHEGLPFFYSHVRGGAQRRGVGGPRPLPRRLRTVMGDVGLPCRRLRTGLCKPCKCCRPALARAGPGLERFVS
jgi:hypothetical protein